MRSFRDSANDRWGSCFCAPEFFQSTSLCGVCQPLLMFAGLRSFYFVTVLGFFLCLLEKLKTFISDLRGNCGIFISFAFILTRSAETFSNHCMGVEVISCSPFFSDSGCAIEMCGLSVRGKVGSRKREKTVELISLLFFSDYEFSLLLLYIDRSLIRLRFMGSTPALAAWGPSRSVCFRVFSIFVAFIGDTSFLFYFYRTACEFSVHFFISAYS